MGMRSSKIKTSGASAGGWVIAAAASLLLPAFFLWMYWSEPARKQKAQEDASRARLTAEIEQANDQKFAELVDLYNERLGSMGEARINGKMVIITLSLESLNLSDRMTKELALAAHSRLGSPIRIETQNGQVVAEAP